jgi:signal transduction histidine kinase
VPEAKELDTQGLRERVTSVFRYAQVGLCVNSVTHDVNNYLGAILAYAELIGMGETLTPDGRRMLNEILESVRRCTAILGTLTTVARRDAPNVAVLDPGKLLRQVVELRSHEVRHQRIQLEVQVEPGLPNQVADLPALELALIYLFTNACEAVADQDVREVRAGVRMVDNAFHFHFWNSGAPIPEADRDAVFQPFVTSKPLLHLGLGLTVARTIAQMHEGSLTYAVNSGFTMTLPRDNRFAKEMQ